MLPGKKKCTKVENYVLFSGLAEALSPESSLSESSEGLLQGGKRGAGERSWDV